MNYSNFIYKNSIINFEVFISWNLILSISVSFVFEFLSMMYVFH